MEVGRYPRTDLQWFSHLAAAPLNITMVPHSYNIQQVMAHHRLVRSTSRFSIRCCKMRNLEEAYEQVHFT